MSYKYHNNLCSPTEDINKQCFKTACGCKKCLSARYPSQNHLGQFRLRLLGGAPIWSIANSPAFSKDSEKRDVSENRPKKESHLSKVSILKKKPTTKISHTLSTDSIGSLSTFHHEDLESASTSGSFSSISSGGHNVMNRIVERNYMEEKKTLMNSPEEKHSDSGCKDIVDYDDDNDNNILSTEVSLSSVAQQNDGEDMSVMESFSDSNLGNVISSPLDPDQMVSDEYLLFHGNMVVDVREDLQCSDKDENEGTSSQDSMQVTHSPTTSEDDYITQNKMRRKSLLPEDHFFKIGEPNVHDEVTMASSIGSQSNEPMETQSTEVTTDQGQKNNDKVPDEQISTKEDFEELIDERCRKGFLIKPLSTQFQQQNVQNMQARSTTATFTAQPTIFTANDLSKKPAERIPQKLSLMPIQTNQRIETSSGTILQKQNITAISANSGSKLTSIILHNSPLRKNVIGVPNLVINASTSQIASILPSHFTVPLISASAVRQLPNVKVIDKPSTSLSLTTQSNCLPKNIFEDDYCSNKGNSDEKKHKQASNEGFRSNLDNKLSIHRIQNSVVKLIDPQGEITNIKPGETLEKMVASTQQHSGNNDQNKIDPVPVITQQKIIERSGHQTAAFPKFMQKISTTNLMNEQLKDTSNTVVLREAPELKMTAHVVHQKEPVMHITTRTDNDDFVSNMSDESKSVVISIPSPTPSQEQMLDNIALQALESTRKDGKGGIESEFQTFDDVLDMIENMNDNPVVLPEPKRHPTPTQEVKASNNKSVQEKQQFHLSSTEPIKTTVDAQISVSVSNVTTRPSVIPQLSPLSQPTDLTTNMANVSQQLRSLLSSLHTTTVCTNTETKVKSVAQKLVTATSLQAATTLHASTPTLRIVDEAGNFITSAEHKNRLAASQNLVKTTFTSSYQQPIQVAGSMMTSTPSLVVTSSAPNSSNTASHTVQSILFTRCMGNSNNLQDRNKSALLEAVTKAEHPTHFEIRRSVPTPVSSSEVTKPSFSLAAILQSHPVSVSSAKSFDNAPVSTSQNQSDNNISSVIQSGPSVTHSPVYTTAIRSISLPQALERAQTSEASLIAANLKLKYMRSNNVIQSKQPEILQTLQPGVVKFEDIKKETVDNNFENKSPVTVASNIEVTSSESNLLQASISQTLANSGRDDDSQNVLLKKLLQNTACASTQTPSSLSTTITTSSLKPDCNSNSLMLETQLIKSSPPITSELPPVTSQSQLQTKIQQKFSIVSRETPIAVSTSIPTSVSALNSITSTTVLSSPVIETKPPEPTPMEVVRPIISRSLSHQEESSSSSPKIPKMEPIDTHIQMSPMQIKKETPTLEQHPMFLQEVKKELLDETSQNSENSEAGSRSDFHIKEEPDSVDPDKLAFDQKEELKKQKRRLYQQKRRQNQILNKEMASQPKKRARKSSKVEEDYDSFIDGVLAQLRSFPAMNILEPQFHRNFNVVPVHGSGDLTKLGTKDYDYRCGDLTGKYGNASIAGGSDYYSAKPYGDCEASPKKPSTTQREFYDDEFPLIKFEADDEKQFDLFCREDTPDSILSDSTCGSPVEDLTKFIGLKLIENDEEGEKKRSASPVVSIVTPIPIRLKPGESPLKQEPVDVDKENIDASPNVKVSNEKPPKANGNLTVTLTLTSAAAEDIMGVLRDLANILHIPAPTGYQILERASTPPGQKYGMYKTKQGKDKDPVDIQSILNGAAKFCKHCDVIILNKMVRKKVSELPFLAKDAELLCENGELSFCSSSCYMQFSLLHRSPTITEAKALEIIDHLSQKNRDIPQRVQSHITALSSTDMMKNYTNNTQYKSFMDTDINYPHLDFKVQCQSGLKEQKYTSVDPQTSKPRLYKGTRYKIWTPHCLQPNVKYRKPSDKETIELLYRLGITVTPAKIPEDTRRCVFCQGVGDGVADGPARLLNFDVDKWVHLNCGLWSDGVYETVNGALMNLENALQQSLLQSCVNCNRLGATIRCFKTRCTNVYHLTCAVKDGCVFFKNKTMFCMLHVPKNEKDNELTTLSVSRRVYVNRDENRQVAAVMHHSDTNNIMRVGSMILLNVGQLLHHQLQNFHNANYIYPIGYKIIRFYWSMRKMNKRCRYICSILDNGGRPEFKVLIQEPPEEDIEFKGNTSKEVWDNILESLAALRKNNYCVQFFPKFVCGEDLFGLTEPAVVRVLESLPGIDTLTDYKFKYGRNPLLELPLAINPSGCARTEAKSRSQLHWKRPHTQRTTGTTSRPLFSVAPPVPNMGFLGESCPYSKQFVHSKSSQYKKMKQEWRNNVFLARSKIQGLGLYAARDLEKHTMVIEYIGELIRSELAETREKQYDAKNRGIYMFRLDEERVVDATLCGGLARYINHSCNPNCVAEIVEVDRDLRIIIFAKRRIQRGEELAYDYKFDIEDDQHKISCMCGAPNCRKWMN